MPKSHSQNKKKSRKRFSFKSCWHFFVAAFFVLIIPFWCFFALPEFTEISEDFSYSANVISYDNFYDSETGKYLGEQQSVTTFSFNAIAGGSEVLEIKNVFDVRQLSGEPIFSVERLYGIDAHTGAHVTGAGDHNREGYLFAPRMSGLFSEVDDKSDFFYWHVNYDQPIEMKFQEEEELFGLKTYRYEANFLADQTANLTNLPDVGITRGINLDVSLTTWIEPTTGHLVRYEDQATAYYYDLETGERIHPWNQFRNSFTESSVSEQALDASFAKQKNIILGFYVPLLFLVLAILFVFQKKIRIFFTQNNDLNDEERANVWLLPLIIFLIIFLITLLLTWFVRAFVLQVRETEFQAEIERANDAILDRLEIYTNALYGGRGLFDASENVSREEWAAYVDSLQIQKNYPGLQGFGYSVWLEPDELTAHEEEIRATGFLDYRVHPEGERDQYTAIIYLEPFDVRNQQAFGFDMFQEQTRRTGMTIARDSGEAALSGKVILVQEIDEDVQAGFLIYIPHYQHGLELNSVEDRQDALIGFVYSPFRMNNFIQGALPFNGGDLNVEIFDGAEPDNLNDDRRMYGQELEVDSNFVSKKKIDFGGHSWTLVYSASPDYGGDFLRLAAPWLVLGFGTFFALLFFILIYIVNTRRISAFVLAQKITKDLSRRTEENEKIREDLEFVNVDLQKKTKELSKKIKEVERVNKHMVDRELKMIELKKQVEDLQTKKKK